MSPATTQPPPARTRGRAALLRQFIVRPFVIGAVAPSSKRLASEMVRGLDLASAEAVLEFGPGTGVFTDAILPRLGPGTKFVPIELNREMVRAFCRRHPGVPIVNDSVEHARRICDDHGIGQVDYILSGLPWASFPESLQVRILDAVLAVLRPGGMLVTFGYNVGEWLPAGRRFYRMLPKYFTKVGRSRIVWRNLPPAFVVRCTR